VGATTSIGVTKDTVAPNAPTASYTDNNNANADVVFGTAEANAAITVTKVHGADGDIPDHRQRRGRLHGQRRSDQRQAEHTRSR
jgi:hypothetical protein